MQAPAFSGAMAGTAAPFTQGIVPTTTLVPATVPLNGGVGWMGAVPTGVMMIAGAAVMAAGM